MKLLQEKESQAADEVQILKWQLQEKEAQMACMASWAIKALQCRSKPAVKRRSKLKNLRRIVMRKHQTFKQKEKQRREKGQRLRRTRPGKAQEFKQTE